MNSPHVTHGQDAPARPRLIVGISGATGFVYGVRALELARELDVEVHLVMSTVSRLTREQETDYTQEYVESLADVVYPLNALGAAISSGSYKTIGMLIAPCSMNTLGSIAAGITPTLLTRAADVVLKERRRLVLMVRETPLNLIHIRNMQAVTEAGAVVFPPLPALYARPIQVDDVITHSAARALDLLGLDCRQLPRWKGFSAEKDAK